MGCIGADQARGRDTVHHRHLHVHQHQVVRCLRLLRARHHVHRLLAVGGQIDQEVFRLQHFGGDLLVDLVVLHQQDARAAQRVEQLGGGGLAAQRRQAVAGGLHAEQGHQRIKQHGVADRLEQDVHDAGLGRALAHGLLAIGGDQHLQRVGADAGGVDAVGQLHAVHLRHLPVGHQHIVGFTGNGGAAQLVQGQVGRDHAMRHAAQAEQLLAQHGSGVGVVVHHQHALVADVGREQPPRPLRAQPQGGGEPEGGALSRRAAHPHLAAHQGRQALADGQPQAGATVFAGGGAVGLGKAGEQARDLLGCQADAGVVHLKAQRGAVAVFFDHGDGDADLALVGELEGVGGVVDQDLAQAQRITDQVDGHIRPDVPDQLQALGIGFFGADAGNGFEHGLQLEGDDLDVQAPGLDLGEVQDVVEYAQEVLTALADFVEVVALACVGLVFQRQVRQADDGVHGGADFVAHIGQEFGLAARGLLGMFLGLHQLELLLLQQPRALGHLLLQVAIELGVFNRDGGLRREPVQHLAPGLGEHVFQQAVLQVEHAADG